MFLIAFFCCARLFTCKLYFTEERFLFIMFQILSPRFLLPSSPTLNSQALLKNQKIFGQCSIRRAYQKHTIVHWQTGWNLRLLWIPMHLNKVMTGKEMWCKAINVLPNINCNNTLSITNRPFVTPSSITLCWVPKVRLLKDLHHNICKIFWKTIEGYSMNNYQSYKTY